MGQNLVSDGSPFVVSEIIAKEIGLQLANRVSGFARHPAITYAGDATYGGSSVIKMDFIDSGASALASTAENTSVTPTEYSTTRSSITLANYRLGRSVSDMLRSLSPSGVVRDIDAFVADAVSCYDLTLANALITAATGSFTQNVGVTETDLTWATFRSAVNTVIGQNAAYGDGGAVAVLHPQQWGDLLTDMAANTGGLGLSQSGQAALEAQAPGDGYRGRFFGCDIFTSTAIPKTNADKDYNGFLTTPGGLVWASAAMVPSMDSDSEILADGGKLLVEFSRDAGKAMTEIYYSCLVGVAAGQTAAGCRIVSEVA